MSYTKFQAKLALAWMFLIHLIKRVVFFWRKTPGLSRFLEVYAADAIFPISEKERAKFPSYEKCQICSLCTFTCEAVKQGSAPSSFEPKFILTGYGRSSHESEYFLEEWLPCLECQSCTIECPNDVPVHEMATQILERRNRLAFRIPQK